MIDVPANNYGKMVVERGNEDTGMAGRESTPRELLVFVVREHTGAVGGGDADSVSHDRFESGAKAGQCKVKCLACKAAKGSGDGVEDTSARDGELELVRWEVSEGSTTRTPAHHTHHTTPHRTAPHCTAPHRTAPHHTTSPTNQPKPRL